MIALLVLLAGVTASSVQAQTLVAATISKGGGVLPDGSIAVVGQTAVGTISNASFSIDLGFAALFKSPTPDCPSSSAPQPDVIEAKNRYLSFSAGEAARSQAIRVTFVNLPGDHAALNGTVMWVGSTSQVSELGGLNDGTPPTFTAASLSCSPVFMDWSGEGTVHVSHEGIVPKGVYDLQVVDEGCDRDSEASFSAPLTVTQAQWADLAGPFSAGVWPSPDGTVDVAFDIIAILEGFKSLPSAPLKARTDLEPATPDRIINITDITRGLDAFKGAGYPFPPISAPCGS